MLRSEGHVADYLDQGLQDAENLGTSTYTAQHHTEISMEVSERLLVNQRRAHRTGAGPHRWGSCPPR